MKVNNPLKPLLPYKVRGHKDYQKILKILDRLGWHYPGHGLKNEEHIFGLCFNVIEMEDYPKCATFDYINL